MPHDGFAQLRPIAAHWPEGGQHLADSHFCSTQSFVTIRPHGAGYVLHDLERLPPGRRSALLHEIDGASGISGRAQVRDDQAVSQLAAECEAAVAPRRKID